MEPLFMIGLDALVGILRRWSDGEGTTSDIRTMHSFAENPAPEIEVWALESRACIPDLPDVNNVWMLDSLHPSRIQAMAAMRETFQGQCRIRPINVVCKRR